jgi:endonuclease G
MKLFLLIPIFLFAFSSKYFNGEINIKCNKVLHKKAFDICYSCKYKEPLIVAYTLHKKLVNKNNFSRKFLHFKPDYNLPTKCRSYPKNYSRTGFDKGHLAPNASFDYNRTIQKETFLMSNIAPQKPQLNRKLWAKVERLERFLATKYEKVNVITGVCGSLGYIKNKVNIPAYWFKVIQIPSIKKYIAFLAPNTNKGMSKAHLKKYKSSLKEIEAICNYSIILKTK